MLKTMMNTEAKNNIKSHTANSFKAPKESLRYGIADAMRQAIIDGVYVSGMPLSENELAKRFKVSRGPVREAIEQLEREHLVRRFPNRGTFVCQLTESEFDEILRMRGVLEPLALEYAATNASPSQIEDIHFLLSKMEKSAEAENYVDYIATDFKFHDSLWQASGRSLLREALVQISRPMFSFFQANASRYERAGLNLVDMVHTHSLMLTYIERKTDLSAAECFQPVIVETERDEKPLLMSAYLS